MDVSSFMAGVIFTLLGVGFVAVRRQVKKREKEDSETASVEYRQPPVRQPPVRQQPLRRPGERAFLVFGEGKGGDVIRTTAIPLIEIPLPRIGQRLQVTSAPANHRVRITHWAMIDEHYAFLVRWTRLSPPVSELRAGDNIVFSLDTSLSS